MNSIGSAHAIYRALPPFSPVSTPDRMLFIIGGFLAEHRFSVATSMARRAIERLLLQENAYTVKSYPGSTQPTS